MKQNFIVAWPTTGKSTLASKDQAFLDPELEYPGWLKLSKDQKYQAIKPELGGKRIILSSWWGPKVTEYVAAGFFRTAKDTLTIFQKRGDNLGMADIDKWHWMEQIQTLLDHQLPVYMLNSKQYLINVLGEVIKRP